MENDEKKEKVNVIFDQTKGDNISITIDSKQKKGKELTPVNRSSEYIEIPAFSLNGFIVFPHALQPLVIQDKNTIKMLEKVSDGDRRVAFFPGLTDKKDADIKISPSIAVKTSTVLLNEQLISRIGVLGRIVKSVKTPDGHLHILLRGIDRAVYLGPSHNTADGISLANIGVIQAQEENDPKLSAGIRCVINQFQEITSIVNNFPDEIKAAVLNLTNQTRIVDLIADSINLSFREKVAILSMEKLEDRLQILTVLLNREEEIVHLSSKIQMNVHEEMGKNQRDFFLREQLRQIQHELGEDGNPDVASIKKRMENVVFPPAVKEILDKELERLDLIPQASGEYNIAYTYIDWLVSVPWSNFTEDRIDVKKAEEILNADHYGLKDVKERILEFLAVLQLRKSRKQPIICFIGPPGVGKTSLGKSIASAMGRKFVRISLGGIRDEAEIRGHRRTYIGALPGRIIQGMKKAGTMNPVFMLDELDKIGNDFHGDPASALLEVLDPQQNNTFNDHYLEADYDLSSVMFIATANVQDTIPGPLLDRMEIIRLPGYTSMEKHQIAKCYLVARQMKENGLKSDDVCFTRGAIDEIINYYTIEAGVRNLERTIGNVCRKIARKIVEGSIPAGQKYVVNDSVIRSLLGPRQFLPDEADNTPKIGVVTGMAWTSVGGSTLEVETTKMPGKGELKLTGSLGDVMKESAMTAFSYIRSHAESLNIPSKSFQEYDFHIHVPDGATPKDGPSAGITLTTALVSLLTQKPVRPHLSMTGEITLLGKVTAIGGVKEKVIAALRYGIYDIIMPKENEKDLEEIPDEIKSRLHFHFVTDISEVLDFALGSGFTEHPEIPAKDQVLNPDEMYTFEIPPDEQEKDSQNIDANKTEKQQKKANPENDVVPKDALKKLKQSFDKVLNDPKYSAMLEKIQKENNGVIDDSLIPDEIKMQIMDMIEKDGILDSLSDLDKIDVTVDGRGAQDIVKHDTQKGETLKKKTSSDNRKKRTAESKSKIVQAVSLDKETAAKKVKKTSKKAADESVEKAAVISTAETDKKVIKTNKKTSNKKEIRSKTAEKQSKQESKSGETEKVQKKKSPKKKNMK